MPKHYIRTGTVGGKKEEEEERKKKGLKEWKKGKVGSGGCVRCKADMTALAAAVTFFSLGTHT